MIVVGSKVKFIKNVFGDNPTSLTIGRVYTVTRVKDIIHPTHGRELCVSDNFDQTATLYMSEVVAHKLRNLPDWF